MVNFRSLRHWVTLEDGVVDHDPATVYSPAQIRAAIQPSAPGAFDEQKVTHHVTVRYHPQISFNTRIRHDGRSLYVRGIQNVDERNRVQMLLCEEVVTPDSEAQS